MVYVWLLAALCILLTPLATLPAITLAFLAVFRSQSRSPAPGLVGLPTLSALFLSQILTTVAVLVSTGRGFDGRAREACCSLMMSTGLTLGAILSLLSMNHHTVAQARYSHPVAAVIGAAVIPAAASAPFLMPGHPLRGCTARARTSNIVCEPRLGLRGGSAD
jgi:hypothetical protein